VRRRSRESSRTVFPVATRLARPRAPLSLFDLGERLPLIRDQDSLARMKPLDQFRKMGLGFFQRDGRHLMAPLLPHVKEIGLNSCRRSARIALASGRRSMIPFGGVTPIAGQPLSERTRMEVVAVPRRPSVDAAEEIEWPEELNSPFRDAKDVAAVAEQIDLDPGGTPARAFLLVSPGTTHGRDRRPSWWGSRPRSAQQASFRCGNRGSQHAFR